MNTLLCEKDTRVPVLGPRDIRGVHLEVGAELVQYRTGISQAVVDESERHLSVGVTPGRRSHTFNPVYNRDLHKMPETARLIDGLGATIFRLEKTQLAFLRTASPADEIFVGNLHVDTGVEHKIANAAPPKHSPVIWRQIVNLGKSARHVELVDRPPEEIDLANYRTQPVTLKGPDKDGYTDYLWPTEEGGVVVEVPGSPEEGVFWSLEFAASHIAHGGITMTSGHHMVSSGKIIHG